MHVSIGMHQGELDTPALCIDLTLMEANISRMAAYFADRPAALRPHTKTHKSPTLAHQQIAAGAIGVTCAKLGEAEVMAQAGIKDILIANQMVGRRKIDRLVNLAAYSQVMAAVDDPTNVEELNAAAQAKGVKLRVLVEVDIGMDRCGVAPGEAALALAQQVTTASALRFEGVMGYEGHTVMIPDYEERKLKTEASIKRLIETKELVEAAGLPVPIVSGGGTGTYDITGNYPGVTEVQAGSYITMDTQYRDIVGVGFECALYILAQVISTPRRGVAIIDGGLKTMTRDFGLPVVAQPQGWQLTGLSEEHGKLQRMGGPELKPGDRVKIYPNHGCTTINLHDHYVVFREGVVEGVWPIAARGRIR